MAITSPANPAVKAVLRLRKRRERDASRTFVVEGEREVGRAVAAGVDLVRVFHVVDGAPAGAAETAGVLDHARGRGVEVTEVAPSVMARMSARDNPSSILAVARMFATDPADAAVVRALAAAANPLVLVVAGIEKPGNLGTMLRSAAAAGADAVVVADAVTDPFNPNVVRASMGAVFSVPVVVADAAESLAWLRRLGVRVVATTPHATRPHWDVPLAGPVALVVGAEHEGLPDSWLDGADDRIAIPMPGAAAGGAVDSINAAATAAVVLFEAVRQRTARAAG